MFCEKCGAQLPDGSKFCTSCGAAQNPVYSPRNSGDTYQLTFTDSIRLFFWRYADFNGRSRRCEFWYVMLFTGIISSVLSGLGKNSVFFSLVSGVWSLAILVPTIALSFRRLHDVGKSGAWYLWNLLPVAGKIILLIQYIADSAPGANQYGPNPKYR